MLRKAGAYGEWLSPEKIMTSMQATVLDMFDTSAADITAGREHSLRSLAEQKR